MDQIKIGRFIAERRKAIGLTQIKLTENPSLADRRLLKLEWVIGILSILIILFPTL